MVTRAAVTAHCVVALMVAAAIPRATFVHIFLASGPRPAGEAVTQEVALFVLAAYGTSGVTGRRRALVGDIVNTSDKILFLLFSTPKLVQTG